jgi:hypothetical protein
MTKRKHISFTDNENHLLDYALKQQPNFPDYIKKLIEYDIQHDIFSKPTINKRNIYDIYNEKRQNFLDVVSN